MRSEEIVAARSLVQTIDQSNWKHNYRVSLQSLMGLRIEHESNVSFMIAHRSFCHQIRLIGEFMAIGAEQKAMSAKLACLLHLNEMQLAIDSHFNNKLHRPRADNAADSRLTSSLNEASRRATG